MFTANCKIPNPPVHFCSEDKNFSDAVRRTEHSGHAFITFDHLSIIYIYIYHITSILKLRVKPQMLVNYIIVFFGNLIYEKYTIKVLWQKKCIAKVSLEPKFPII